MGVAVSNWRLARAVSRLGELGVISGTLIAVVLARRLEAGDPEGEMRRALASFPIPDVAARVLERHYIPGGKSPESAYGNSAMPSLRSPAELTELTVTATFAEVFLAKEGHSGKVGMNLLEKLQLTTLPCLYGAMLAGVDCVLMGAGIPRSIPGALDRLARGETAELRIDVLGAGSEEEFTTRFDPQAFCGGSAPQLHRPAFFAIVSSATLAMTLAKKSNGRVDGFVVEGEAAGGHNAPPRGPQQLSAEGEPVYGARDVPDLEKIRQLGLPFWIAGAQASSGKLAEAQALGARGVQIGTAFAFCDESGVTDELKRAAIEASREGSSRIFTDPSASPTGFPFKVLGIAGTVSDPALYASRERVCDLGYLRLPYKKPDGGVGYRCPAEPVEDYVRKGGAEADTRGRKCLCNGLLATVGLGQVRRGVPELSIITAGREAASLARLVPPGQDRYSAADVVRIVRGA
ncbi:2-nitropropane dioxygenase [Opitutaceae bacterium EW11]|nr:2-nitropropane dioxygenase [Opitutaceae bacterium EW11]